MSFKAKSTQESLSPTLCVESRSIYVAFVLLSILHLQQNNASEVLIDSMSFLESCVTFGSQPTFSLFYTINDFQLLM